MTLLQWLALAVVLVAAMILRGKFLSRGIPQLDAATIVRKRSAGENIVLLDVRTAAERSARSIKGSMHIPLGELDRRMSELESVREREIICYCASGQRSASAAYRLKKRGFLSANLVGGISAWREA